jgi:hypothetical protein
MPRQPQALPETFQDMSFPLSGIDLSMGFSNQRRGTTIQGQNVRAFEASTQRARGGMRPGLGQFIAGQVISGCQTAIQELNTVTAMIDTVRVTTVVTVCNGYVYYGNSSLTAWVTTGSASLNGGAAIIRSAPNVSPSNAAAGTATQVLYFVDGTHMVFFDPGNGNVQNWFASAGSLPADTDSAPGTITSATANGTTTLTGNGTQFGNATSVPFVGTGTLVGNGSNGFYVITATANTTSCTINAFGVDPGFSAADYFVSVDWPTLICTWRGRTVLSGLPFDPQNWFMSAQGNPSNFNYAPFPTVATQAVAGNNSPAGLCGDTITALIPFNDDILIFGCANSIWMMMGDPMAGGSIYLVTDKLGMAVGAPWCKDPYGNLYFVGGRGGIFMIAPGGQPQRISQPVEVLIEAVNYASAIVRLVWEDLWQGIHVFITPLLYQGNGTITSNTANGTTTLTGNGTAFGNLTIGITLDSIGTPSKGFYQVTSVANSTSCTISGNGTDPGFSAAAYDIVPSAQHLFYEQRNGAWWTQVFTNAMQNPICCAMFDSNVANDRVLMIGSWDGVVRYFTQGETQDDGWPILTAVMLGPIMNRTLDDFLLKDVQVVMGETSGNATVSVYIGKTAEAAAASSPVLTNNVTASLNPNMAVRWAARAIYVRIQAAGPWAMEIVRARIAGMGKVRRRTP